MAWTTPKTDWAVKLDEDGTYLGDFFEAGDYGRIKGNLQALCELAAGLYPAVELPEIPDITAESVYDETAANALEQSLEALRRGTFAPGLPETKTWRGNDAAPLAEDYNRIEGACLRLYQTLTQQAQARPRLAIILGGVQF